MLIYYMGKIINVVLIWGASQIQRGSWSYNAWDIRKDTSDKG